MPISLSCVKELIGRLVAIGHLRATSQGPARGFTCGWVLVPQTCVDRWQGLDAF
jgi:hypothetical protein